MKHSHPYLSYTPFLHILVHKCTGTTHWYSCRWLHSCTVSKPCIHPRLVRTIFRCNPCRKCTQNPCNLCSARISLRDGICWENKDPVFLDNWCRWKAVRKRTCSCSLGRCSCRHFCKDLLRSRRCSSRSWCRCILEDIRRCTRPSDRGRFLRVGMGWRSTRLCCFHTVFHHILKLNRMDLNTI